MLQQEPAAGEEAGVEAGGEACNVSGDVGQHLCTGLVIVGDLEGGGGERGHQTHSHDPRLTQRAVPADQLSPELFL